MDDRLFRNAMGKFATGVTVITTVVDGKPYGMTANAFMSVSLNPKLVVISIGEKAKMNERIKQSKKYAVSFLADDQQAVSMQFAGQKSADDDFEFADLNEMPVIKNALGVLTCDVVSEYVAGDHTFYIGEVTDILLAENDQEPLLFYQGKYRELVGLEEKVSN